MEKLEKGTFYRSYYEAGKFMPDDLKLQYYEKVFSYLFDGEETKTTGMVEAVFQAIKPNIKCSRERAFAGERGGAPVGNKNASKKQAKNKQKTSNDKEKEKDNNKDNNDEVYTQAGHLSITHDEFTKLEKEFGMEKADELVQSVLNYRKNGKYKNLYLTAIKWGRAEKKKSDISIKTVKRTFNFLTGEQL